MYRQQFSQSADPFAGCKYQRNLRSPWRLPSASCLPIPTALRQEARSRLGRKPDPWAMPDWASAGPDGTFGNRFDDPDATYRVLYASSQRLGCFLETRARFRVDPKLLTELAEIAGEDDHLCQPVRPATQRKCSVYVLTV